MHETCRLAHRKSLRLSPACGPLPRRSLRGSARWRGRGRWDRGRDSRIECLTVWWGRWGRRQPCTRHIGIGWNGVASNLRLRWRRRRRRRRWWGRGLHTIVLIAGKWCMILKRSEKNPRYYLPAARVRSDMQSRSRPCTDTSYGMRYRSCEGLT
jgi:hypothetical protein